MKVTLKTSIFFLLCSGLVSIFYSCKKDNENPPIITTINASDITQTTVVSGGVVTNEGGSEVLVAGVCWDTSPALSVKSQHTNDGKGIGSFLSSLNGLKPNTKYYIRAYAYNKAGTGYGNEISFTTKPIVGATLTTAIVTSITSSSAISGGNITADGGGTVSARGVCWDTLQNPSIVDNITSDGTGSGDFISNITGLHHAKVYHVRAYATNSSGTAYGEELTFTTLAVIPTVTTIAVTDVTQTTATSGGDISYDGGSAVTERGICWNIIKNPTISESHSTNGSGTGSFINVLTSLIPGTTYYIRAYATNSAGTGYGNEVLFTTKPVVGATISTDPVSSVTSTTAVSGGNITNDGGGYVTARGICWAIAENPTTTDNKTSDGTGTGTFTSNISGLSPGTLYHVRAYACNSSGTAYGSDLTFTTLPILPNVTTATVTAITPTTATASCDVTESGGANVTAKGVCWGSSPNLNITNSHTNDGTGTGIFTSSITGLAPGTTYYIRAYATNSAGTAYGDEITFSTPATIPSLSTVPISNVATNSAESGGNITSDGGSAINARGICWATTNSPTINNNKTLDGTGSGSFTSNLTGLQTATTYHVRAYATNAEGTAYGDDITFTTRALIATLTTATITDITSTTATSGGNITYDGGSPVTERGVCWSTEANPTTSNSKIFNGSGSGSFTGNLSGLLPGTTYFVRAFAINNAGTAYGNQVSFTTTPEQNPNPVINFYKLNDGSLLLHSVGDKRIILKSVDGNFYIKFSSDNGASYNNGVRITGKFTFMIKARILSNGNIVLFYGNQIFYSSNNLESISPCTVLNKDGSVYSLHNPVNSAYPGAYYNFMGGFVEYAGVCLLGNYTSTSIGASPVNLYYSLDGITWKVCYTFGRNPNCTDDGTENGGVGGTQLGDPNNPLIARHIHSVNIGEDGNFYVCTGDIEQEMHFLKCSYNRNADTWNINDLLTGESKNWQRMRALGVFERNGYLYWGSDGPGTFTFKGLTYDCWGIYKCSISDINDPSKHILLQSLTNSCYSFLNVGHIVFAGLQNDSYIYISFDYGETWSSYAKPLWMTGSVEGVWYNEFYKYFVTNQGVQITSSSF
jgi:hypothetical protein